MRSSGDRGLVRVLWLRSDSRSARENRQSGRGPGPEELEEALRRHLALPVIFEKSGEDVVLKTESGARCAPGGPFVDKLSDLLFHSRPPVELLAMVKQFAKSNRGVRRGPLPRAAAIVLYYAAIAAALARCGERITSLDDEQLRQGFDWVLARRWVDEQTRALVSTARAVVSSDTTWS